ncbi:MAG: glycosyl transferase group 1, partial [Candidatus Binatus sp.]|nr:glycosyl transferase group 1 [Candidatus Binatus sp.]
ARLRHGNFDALWILGYAHRGCLVAIAAARSLGIPVLLRGESNPCDEKPGTIRVRAKRATLPRLYRAIAGFLAIGKLNREHYLRYGVEEERIFAMPYAVDNDFFRAACDKARPRREYLRADLGLQGGRPVILFASKMQPHKRAGDLLEAYIRMSGGGNVEPPAYLIFAGDGEERSVLEHRAQSLKWNSIRFVGFKNQTELPALYDLCDMFVLPSEREPWGLVVNEVMNAAKPVIVSDHVGAGPDLIEDGVTGFVYPTGDVSALAALLRKVNAVPEHCAAMGQRARERVAAQSFEADRQGLREAVVSLTSGKSRVAA